MVEAICLSLGLGGCSALLGTESRLVLRQRPAEGSGGFLIDLLHEHRDVGGQVKRRAFMEDGEGPQQDGTVVDPRVVAVHLRRILLP
ncbi:hypothetical protein ABE10_00555, partial [Bacillus toyonensis]|nr:hypothetical protein [Bacillus toyonensis]